MIMRKVEAECKMWCFKFFLDSYVIQQLQLAELSYLEQHQFSLNELKGHVTYR